MHDTHIKQRNFINFAFPSCHSLCQNYFPTDTKVHFTFQYKFSTLINYVKNMYNFYQCVLSYFRKSYAIRIGEMVQGKVKI